MFLAPGTSGYKGLPLETGLKTTQTDVLGVLDDHASALIHLQFDAAGKLPGPTMPWSECSGRVGQRNMRRCRRHALAPRQSFLLCPPSNESPVCPGFPCEATPDLRSVRRARGVRASSSCARRCTLRLLDLVEARHLWPWNLQVPQQPAEKHGSGRSQNSTSPVGCCVSLPSEPNISIWCSNPAKGNVAGDAVICWQTCTAFYSTQ